MTDLEHAKQIVADAFNGGLAAGRKNGLMEAATLLDERASRIVADADAALPDTAFRNLTTVLILSGIAAELLEMAK